MRELISRLKWLFNRRRREADLDAELSFHLATEVEDRVAHGASEGEAMYAARRDLGNVTLVRENTRATWGWVALEQFLQDIRYGLRGLGKSRAFTATAVLSLALGIGANTAIFSLLDALLLRWLPVRDPQQLVLLRVQAVGANAPTESFSYPIVRALADRDDIFTGVAGFSGWNLNVGLPGSTVRVPGAVVTGAYYETLGLNPVIGRLLTPQDDRRGAPAVAVISYGYWERQYGRSTDIAGKVITINGVPVTILGVSPPGFVGANVGAIADITMPVAAIPIVNPEAAILLGPGNFWLRILARPKPGLSTLAANARLR